MADTKSITIITFLFAIVTFNVRPSAADCACNPLGTYGTGKLGFYNDSGPFHTADGAILPPPFIAFYGNPPTTYTGPATCLYAAATCNITCTNLAIIDYGGYISINGFSNSFGASPFHSYANTTAGVSFIDITAATIINATYIGIGITNNGTVTHNYTYADYGFSSVNDCMSCCNYCCPQQKTNGDTSVGPYLSLSYLTLFYITSLALNDFFDKFV